MGRLSRSADRVVSTRGRKRLPRRGSLARFDRDRRQFGKIDDFVAKHVAADPFRHGAKERAIQAAASEFRCERSTVQRAIARFKPWHKLKRELASTWTESLPEIERQLELVHRQFTERELAELAGVAMALVHRLAMERAELKVLRSRK